MIRAALFGTLVVWFATVAIASMTGVFQRWPPYGIASLVAAGILLPVASYFSSDGVKRLVEGVGLKTVTGFHIWRVGAALLFFWYGAHELLPKTFVQRAAWGDLVVGLLAAIVVFVWPAPTGYLLFHVIGLLDFVVAVGTGLTLTIALAPQIQNLVGFPVALIPLFGVGLSGATHLIAFDMLRRHKV